MTVTALRSAYEFFGPEQLLFGPDVPFDAEGGDIPISRNLEAFEELDVPDAERERIASCNLDWLVR